MTRDRDAHAVYDPLYASGDVVEVGGWAHVRRCFFEALDGDPERARTRSRSSARCSRSSGHSPASPPGKRGAVRQRESRPMVERFFTWRDAEAERVLDETPIARAVGYARNQRERDDAQQRLSADPFRRAPLDLHPAIK